MPLSIRRVHLCALLAALICGPALGAAAAPEAPPSSGTVALVNGHPLSQDLLDLLARSVAGVPASDLTAEQRSALLDSLVRAEIIAQQAEKLGLNAPHDIAIPDPTPTQIAFARLQALDAAAGEAFARDQAPADSELRSEYERQFATMPRIQYHAHHILLETRDAAEKVLRQLKGGADFEALAATASTDTSASKGGDLGWFSANALDDAFAAALRSLKKGEVTPAPVQTSFGWHVIRLDDTRALEPPSFESLKERLTEIVRARKVDAYVARLFKAADVQKFP